MPAFKPETSARPRHILPVIVIAQFAGTSLWFAGNAVLGDLQRVLALPATSLGPMISSVQLGFIIGTLCVAGFGIADRFSPRLVFLCSALAGAAFNFAITIIPGGLIPILCLRFLTGVCLAGVYPVGMKIASGWYRGDLGAALGWLVGALVIGTALPHGVRALGNGFDWHAVMATVSVFAALGGILLFALVPDGPHLGKAATFKPSMLLQVLAEPQTRAAALGYWGHMWELYAFWAVVPVLVTATGIVGTAVSGWSFLIIGIGFLGCGLGGLISLRTGSASVARGMLATSGALCILSPLLLRAPSYVALAGLLIWGFAVVGDSPQFSTLVAHSVAKERVGTALTLINSVGFAITIPAIELLSRVSLAWSPVWAMLILAPGPLFGLYASRALRRATVVS